MIIIIVSQKKLKNSNYYNKDCWDYPLEELDFLRENEEDNNIEVYALTEKNRIYETTCTIDDIKKL